MSTPITDHTAGGGGERPWQPWERNYSGNRVGVRVDGDWTILHVLSGGAETTTSIREHEAWDLAGRVSPKLLAMLREVGAENRRMRDALHELSTVCAAGNAEALREAAEEIYCGDDCEDHSYDASCNSHDCHLADTDGGCRWHRSESLKSLADALETHAAPAAPTGPEKAEPVAWAWEEEYASGWRIHASVKHPGVRVGARNARPLYEHPPAGDAGVEPVGERAEGVGDNCPAPADEPKPGTSPLDTALRCVHCKTSLTKEEREFYGTGCERCEGRLHAAMVADDIRLFSPTPAEPPVSPAGGEDLKELSARKAAAGEPLTSTEAVALWEAEQKVSGGDDDEPLRSWNTEEHAERIYAANTGAPRQDRIDWCRRELTRRMNSTVDRLARDHGLTSADLLASAKAILAGRSAPAEAGEDLAGLKEYVPQTIYYEDADVAEYVTRDCACLYERVEHGAALVRDMQTREIIGFRIQGPMAWAFEISGALLPAASRPAVGRDQLAKTLYDVTNRIIAPKLWPGFEPRMLSEDPAAHEAHYAYADAILALLSDPIETQTGQGDGR